MSYPELREALHAEAESALAGVDAAILVRTGLAAHRRRRRAASTVAAAAALALAAGAVPLVRAATHTRPAKPAPALKTYKSPLDWPTRGSLAGDKELTRSLEAALVTPQNPHRIAYIGPGPGNHTWGIVTERLAPTLVGMTVCVLGPAERELPTGLIKTRKWVCVDGSDGSAVSAATGGTAQIQGFDTWVQVALLPPDWHVRSMSDLYFTPLDDAGRPLDTSGVELHPVTELADGIMIKYFIQAPLGAGLTVPAMRVGAESPNGTASILDHTGRQDLFNYQILWGWGPKKELRGLPQALDNPEQNPGMRVWARLHDVGSVMPGYFSPIWGGTLADGSRAILIEPMSSARVNTAFMVNPHGHGNDDTFLVRDLPVPADPTTVHEISAYLPLSDGRCELVAVGAPGTTRFTYRDSATSSFTELPQPQHDGVGRFVLPTCGGHQGAAIQVFAGSNRTYEGPIDSTLPDAGPKH